MVWLFFPLHARLKVGRTLALCSCWADLALLAARGREAQQHFHSYRLCGLLPVTEYRAKTNTA